MQTIVYQCYTAMSAQKLPNCCFIVTVSFAAKEYIICYPAMDFPEVEACGTGW